MKKISLFSIIKILFACFFLMDTAADGALMINALRCEYQTNPLAVDTTIPRLGWGLDSPQRNQEQSAYQVLVASEERRLQDDTGDLWDSGKIQSSQSIQVPYGGKELVSFQRCYWKVRVWDRNDRPSPWSEVATWSMGILQEKDWNAQWITAGETTSSLPIFRREFFVEKPIRSARVFICGLGFYELRLNGEKVGDLVFDPGWTNYRKTCLYSTYDITQQLKHDRNALGVMLGNGMYNVSGGRYVKFTGTFGEPKLILRLHIEYADGSVSELVSDPSWKWVAGPIVFSCIYGGEDYDARLEPGNWDRAEIDDSQWKPAVPCDGPGGKLISQMETPIRVIQELEPVKVTTPQPGITLYDLGQNFSGIPWIQVRGKKGSSLKITPAEQLTENGIANQAASGGPHTYTYILKGEGIETWQPRFTYYGFQFLQVETSSPDSAPELVKIKGLFTRNSARRVGEFTCSDDLYNRIFRLIDWSVGSNLQSVLTDCPHREKLGWLEVSHLMAPAILFNYDVPLFYNKVIRDIRDTQLDSGLIPDIAPEYVEFSAGFRDSPEWGSAGVILPWILYQWFADERALQSNYESMKRYVDYLSSTAKDRIVSHGLGDWYDYVRGGEVGESRLTPKSLTATAMYYRDTFIVAETAKILGRNEDSERYSNLAEEIRVAFNRHLYNAETHHYATGSQTANAIPLVWDIVDPVNRDAVIQNLITEVKERDYLTSGDVGFHFLLRALAENGRSDLVYRLTHRQDEPGYGYQIKQGATSLTEAWDGRKVVSLNHCMLGHLQEWFYRELVGIQRDPSALAFKKIDIHPNPVGSISWVKGSYDSPYGKIACSWKRENQTFVLETTIPANITARIFVPTRDAERITESGLPVAKSEMITFLKMHEGYAVYSVGSGTYRFVSPYDDPTVDQ